MVWDCFASMSAMAAGNLLTGKKRKAGNRQYHLSLRPYEGGLYRVEAAEALENGEYSISPEGSNTSFCFRCFKPNSPPYHWPDAC